MAKPTELAAEIDALLGQQTLPPLDKLLHMLKQRGFRLNNLFNRMDGQYQCNLRSADNILFFEFAYGVTAGDAVLKALKKTAEHKIVRGAKTSDDDLDPRQVGITRCDGVTSDSDADAGQSESDAREGDEDLIG